MKKKPFSSVKHREMSYQNILEHNNPSRILYAGPNFSDSGVVLFRLIELSRGVNFLEKTVFDYSDKSIYTKMIFLDRSNFNKILSGKEQEYENIYKKSNNPFGSVSIYRENSNGHIRSNMIYNMEYKGSSILNFLTYWKLRLYFNK